MLLMASFRRLLIYCIVTVAAVPAEIRSKIQKKIPSLMIKIQRLTIRMFPSIRLSVFVAALDVPLDFVRGVELDRELLEASISRLRLALLPYARAASGAG
jgi:hypothetical protein